MSRRRPRARAPRRPPGVNRDEPTHHDPPGALPPDRPARRRARRGAAAGPGRGGHTTGSPRGRRGSPPPRPPRRSGSSKVADVAGARAGDRRPRRHRPPVHRLQGRPDPDPQGRHAARRRRSWTSRRSVSKGGEQGLLGLAFHPSFKTNRKFYVNYTNRAGDTVVREYRASATNPNVVASGSGRTIIKIAQPYANHNGGMLAFGRDGYLYIGMGDGGSGGDPGNRAQNMNSLLGKMLRINVNGSTATRNYRIPSSNPYVGQARPERDLAARPAQPVALLVRPRERQPLDRRRGPEHATRRWTGRSARARGPAGRVNWGWRVMEGNHCYLPATRLQHAPARSCRWSSTATPATAGAPSPGGYVYRGSAIPALRGWYVYGDYCSGEVWAVASGASRPATPVAAARRGIRAADQRRSARTTPASCTCATWRPAPSTGSWPARRVAARRLDAQRRGPGVRPRALRLEQVRRVVQPLARPRRSRAKPSSRRRPPQGALKTGDVDRRAPFPRSRTPLALGPKMGGSNSITPTLCTPE